MLRRANDLRFGSKLLIAVTLVALVLGLVQPLLTTCVMARCPRACEHHRADQPTRGRCCETRAPFANGPTIVFASDDACRCDRPMLVADSAAPSREWGVDFGPEVGGTFPATQLPFVDCPPEPSQLPGFADRSPPGAGPNHTPDASRAPPTAWS